MAAKTLALDWHEIKNLIIMTLEGNFVFIFVDDALPYTVSIGPYVQAN